VGHVDISPSRHHAIVEEAIAMRKRFTPSERRPTFVPLALASMLVTAGCGGPASEPAAQPDNVVRATVTVEVFFANESLGEACGEVFPVTRTVDRDDPVQGALEALLAGPTAAEQAEGYGGWFSAGTADTLLDVTIVDGTAHVVFTDLRQLIPNASTSCGSAGLLAQLDQTLLSLDGITASRYALADQTAFYAWLQLDDPDARQPDDEAAEPEHQEPDGPEAEQPLAAPDAGWAVLPDFEWPVFPQCCGAPITGPPSPDAPLPATGWPADGFYDVDVVRPVEDLDLLRLTISKWLRLEELPEVWEGASDVLVADSDAAIERQLAAADLAVVLVPIHEGTGTVSALSGEPGAFARLLEQGIDPAFRVWVYESLARGVAIDTIRQDLLERSTDPTFPFGQDHNPDVHAAGPLAYRGPLGSSLLADPSWMQAPSSWPPGGNGMYDWNGVTLEIRDGQPVLYVWAGAIAG
jgi:hypothetical protein